VSFVGHCRGTQQRKGTITVVAQLTVPLPSAFPQSPRQRFSFENSLPSAFPHSTWQKNFFVANSLLSAFPQGTRQRKKLGAKRKKNLNFAERQAWHSAKKGFAEC